MALEEEIVELRRLALGIGALVELPAELLTLRRGSLEEARLRFRDALHQHFYFRGKPSVVRELDAKGPSGGFSMWSSRRRRQEWVAFLWARCLADDFEDWVAHIEGLAERPVGLLHDEIWESYREATGELYLDYLDLRQRTHFEPVVYEMLNTIHVWARTRREAYHLSSSDRIAMAIYSETAAQVLTPERLVAMGAINQRADLPRLLALVSE